MSDAIRDLLAALDAQQTESKRTFAVWQKGCAMNGQCYLAERINEETAKPEVTG